MNDTASWERLLPLVADRITVVHTPPGADEPADLSGGDIDCAVVGIDPQWPLRATGGWRVCQRLHYDLLGWCWVVERDGTTVAIDTLDDPYGIGRDAFPSPALVEASEGPHLPEAVRAAYLTAKRVRKRMADKVEWERIIAMARHDPDRYVATLRAVLGDRVVDTVALPVLAGSVPSDGSLASAHRAQLLHRVRSPRRLLLALALGARRIRERVADPTGLLVVVGGVEGAGKSTITRSFVADAAPLFRKVHHAHWRPGLLPRPGQLAGRAATPSDAPHARPPYGRAASLALLTYYWADFVVGGWAVWWSLRLRTGLVAVERGWTDIAVDPLRYRLDVPSGVVRALGRFVPRPDLLVVLDTPPDVAITRKQEIDVAELARQREAWLAEARRAPAATVVDATAPASAVGRRVFDDLAVRLADRTARRVGGGWVSLPPGPGRRFVVPRRPRSAAAAALSLYQPVTARSRRGWLTARTAAAAGAFALAPRSRAPEAAIREAVADLVPRGGTIAVSRLSGDRAFVAVLDGRGRWAAAVKVALDPDDHPRLAREAAAIRDLGRFLAPPLAAPTLVDERPGVLVTDPVAWHVRRRPHELPPDVAEALGAFWAASRAAHGDVAPWNLLAGDDLWVLVDWEDAAPDAPVFGDLCHFHFQAHALLGAPAGDDLVAGFVHRRGAVGTVVSAYASGAGVSPSDAVPAMRAYLAHRADDARLVRNVRAASALRRLTAAFGR